MTEDQGVDVKNPPKKTGELIQSMPEQLPKIETEPGINPHPAGERKSTIRTMKSDVEELFKTTKPSLIQLIGQEAGAKKFEKEKERGGSKKIYFYSAILITVFIFLGVGAYLLFVEKEPEPRREIKLVPPSPFFATETSRTISVRIDNRAQFLQLVEDSMREIERTGTIKRLIIKLQNESGERFATIKDFLSFYHISPPAGLLEGLNDNVMFFIYNGGPNGNRIGFALGSRDANRTWRDLIFWESSFLSDLQPLFFAEKPEIVIAPFEDRTYRNVDWRFLKMSQEKDLGIGYTIFNAGNILILTTGKEAMETVINRLSAR